MCFERVHLHTLHSLHEPWKVAAPKDHTLDANNLAGDTEKDNVAADYGQSGILADFGPQLVQQGASANPAKLFSNFLNEADRPTRIVLGDPVGDLFEIPLYIVRKFESHLFGRTRCIGNRLVFALQAVQYVLS